MKKTREELKNQIIEDLYRCFDGKIELKTVQNTDGEHEKLVATKTGERVGMALEMNTVLDIFEGMSYGDAFQMLVEKLNEEPPKRLSDSVYWITDWKRARHKLFMRVTNAEKAKEAIKTGPSKTVFDLALLLYVYVDCAEDNGGNIRVTNELMEVWGVTEEEAWKAAEEEELFVMKIEPLFQFILENTDLNIDDYAADQNLYICTNERCIYGASQIFYPGAMEKAYKRIGGNFYIAPSSIYETILIKDDMYEDAKMLLEMVKEINATEVAEDDRLTDSLYYYNGETNTFSQIIE